MSRTYFAYHLTHYFGPFGLASYHTNSDKPAEGDLVYVVSGDTDPEAGGVDYFLEGVFRIRRRLSGPWSLKNLSGQTKSYQFRLSMEPVRQPDSPIALSVADWYDRKEVHRFFSSGQNFNPLPTEPDYKSRFDELLAGYASNEADNVVADLEVLNRVVPNETERAILSKARLGQGKFRTDLVAAWRRGEVCALTGVAVPEMLIASHIKPWRDCTNDERLDPMNGLLLVAHVDKLFDRYLLSFKKSVRGFVSVIHPRIQHAVSGLSLKNGMMLDTTHLSLGNEAKFGKYMEHHLNRHLELVAQSRPIE